MTSSDYIQIGSIIMTTLGAVLASYIKLKDQLNELSSQQKVTQVIAEVSANEINIIQRDVHNIALIIGTKRAIAEEQTKEKTK